jgi:YidC/Oxa1 family membrane protein insertase
MKKQQETMKLYNKAGVNPMVVVYRTDASTYILCFISILSFGNKFETKGFLWADDLSSFDSFMSYHVPLYTVIILVCFLFWPQ